MKRYRVDITYTGIVETEDEDDAIEEAWNELFDGNASLDVEVEPLEENAP